SSERMPRPRLRRTAPSPCGFRGLRGRDRKSTRLNSSHEWTSYAVFCLKKKSRQLPLDLRLRDDILDHAECVPDSRPDGLHCHVGLAAVSARLAAHHARASADRYEPGGRLHALGFFLFVRLPSLRHLHSFPTRRSSDLSSERMPRPRLPRTAPSPCGFRGLRG